MRVVAVVPGQLTGVTQDATRIAWLDQTQSGCKLVLRPVAGGLAQVFQSHGTGCPEDDLALAGDAVAWGGYDDVRCSETTEEVDALVAGRIRQVESMAGDCLGYDTAFQGLASDGRSFLYAVLDTRPRDPALQRCGEGGLCRWQLQDGRIVRIVGSRRVLARGLPPAALIAAASGRVALAQPERAAAAVNSFDWPRAATNGAIQVRDSNSGRLVTSFRPAGIVRALALSATRAVVLVESTGKRFRIESYDASSGARLSSTPAAATVTSRLSTDGRYVAYDDGHTVRVLDLDTGAQRAVWHASASLTIVGLSVVDGRLTWGVNAANARILSAAAAT